jgi:hypothetical protein
VKYARSFHPRFAHLDGMSTIKYLIKRNMTNDTRWRLGSRISSSNSTRACFGECSIRPRVRLRLRISIFRNTLANGWTRTGSASVNDFAQRSSRVVTSQYILCLGSAINALMVLRRVVNHGHHITIRNDIESLGVQSLYGDRWFERLNDGTIMLAECRIHTLNAQNRPPNIAYLPTEHGIWC